jgi:uncharacterized membrane protein
VLLGVLQAIAVGIIIAGIGGRRYKHLGLLTSGFMLAVIAAGLTRSPEQGLWVAAGTAHALLYGALLVLFVSTLLPGRTDLITRVARRLNPNFHAGMRYYTWRVTVAWCGFFAAQLVASALLSRFAPAGWWLLFVNGGQLPLVAIMFLGEYGIRRRLFPGAESTNLATMVRGMRGSGGSFIRLATGAARETPATRDQAGPRH